MLSYQAREMQISNVYKIDDEIILMHLLFKENEHGRIME